MIAMRIDLHVRPRRHVTRDALRACGARRMMMVIRRIEFRRRMTLRAHRIAGGAQLAAMRFVAVGACDSGGVHATLHERAPGVDLVRSEEHTSELQSRENLV